MNEEMKLGMLQTLEGMHNIAKAMIEAVAQGTPDLPAEDPKHVSPRGSCSDTDRDCGALLAAVTQFRVALEEVINDRADLGTIFRKYQLQEHLRGNNSPAADRLYNALETMFEIVEAP